MLEQPRSRQRFADHYAFGIPHAGERAELRVTAFDELRERRMREPCRDSSLILPELGPVARQRLTLFLVVLGDVDHK